MSHSARWRQLRIRDIEAVESDGRPIPEPSVLSKLSETAVHLLLVAQPVVVTAIGSKYRVVAGGRSLGIARACLPLGAEIRVVVVDSGDRGVAQALRTIDELLAPTLLSLPTEELVGRWARVVEEPDRVESLGWRLTHEEAARCAGVSRSHYFRVRATRRSQEGKDDR